MYPKFLIRIYLNIRIIFGCVNFNGDMLHVHEYDANTMRKFLCGIIQASESRANRMRKFQWGYT